MRTTYDVSLLRCWHSINLTLRALKGLRRAQWANMSGARFFPLPEMDKSQWVSSLRAASRFSVLYAVPVEAFPVVWERPQELGVHGESW